MASADNESWRELATIWQAHGTAPAKSKVYASIARKSTIHIFWFCLELAAWVWGCAYAVTFLVQQTTSSTLTGLTILAFCFFGLLQLIRIRVTRPIASNTLIDAYRQSIEQAQIDVRWARAGYAFVAAAIVFLLAKISISLIWDNELSTVTWIRSAVAVCLLPVCFIRCRFIERKSQVMIAQLTAVMAQMVATSDELKEAEQISRGDAFLLPTSF